MIPLAPGSLHVSRVRLDDARAPSAWDRAGALSADERARADRFHRECDRASFIASRAALRAVLGRDVGPPAARLTLVVGARGKPRRVGGRGLEFSRSHSGGRMLCAGARGTPVDVERIDAGVDVRGRAFYRPRTRKDAVLKAMGVDLSVVPTAVDVLGSAAGGWLVRTLDAAAIEGCLR